MINRNQILGVLLVIGLACSSCSAGGPEVTHAGSGSAGDAAGGGSSATGSGGAVSVSLGGVGNSAGASGSLGTSAAQASGGGGAAGVAGSAAGSPPSEPDPDENCTPGVLPGNLSGSEAVCLAPDVPCGPQGVQGRIDRHNSYVAIAKQGNVDFLLLGDFLCDDFRGDGGAFKETKQVYDEAFGQYRPANFCEGGDMTEHVLWRIQNGELDGIQPKVVMLHVGTTNGGRNDKPERILAGIKAIIDYTLQKIPGVKILLVPVLPWGSGDVNRKHTSVNALLPSLDDCGKTVRLVDIYGEFLRPDGTLPMPTELTRDAGVHLNAAGYQVWADAIAAPLHDMMAQ